MKNLRRCARDGRKDWYRDSPAGLPHNSCGRRFFFATLAGLIPGTLRNEIVALLAGAICASVLILSMLVTAIRRVARPLLRVKITAQPELVHHGGTTDLRVSVTPVLRRSIASIHVASGERCTDAQCTTVTGHVATGPLLRGVYRPTRVTVSWYDPLSLTRLEYRGTSDRELLRVLPYRKPVPLTPDSRGATDRHPDDAISLERNTELTEARPYHPGDDPRQIHWGMYAHTGDLFVRIGDEIPPPTGDRVVAVDLNAAQTPEAVDTLTAVALGLAERAAAEGETVSLCLLERELRWYVDVDEAEWDFARLQPVSHRSGDNGGAGGNGVAGGRGEIGGIDLSRVNFLVTGGVSRYAPHQWAPDTTGVAEWRQGGAVPVFTVATDARS